MNYEVSILVPVYKVSDYIERCAHSLFQQTFESIEYIFVNDCTPDDSMKKLISVIEKYPNRQKNIKIINNPQNLGISYSRNKALNISSGKYILFVDSDDYIESDMVETLYSAITRNDADIAICDFIREYGEYNKKDYDLIPKDHETLIREVITTKQTQTFLWNRLVKRYLYELEDLLIPEGLNYLEDRYIVTRMYYYSNNIIKIDKPLYHYRLQNVNSISKQKTKMHFDNVVLFWEKTDEFFKKNNMYDRYENIIDQSKVKNKANLMMGTNSYQLRKEYSYIFRDIEKKYAKYLRQGERILLTLIRLKLFRTAHLFRQIIWYKNK